MNFLKERKIYVFIAIMMVLYTIMLGAFGVFGNSIQDVVLHYGFLILKYGAIVFGYFLTIFVPFRAVQQLKKNKIRQQDFDNEQRMMEQVRKQKELENKIYEGYVKHENDL